MERKRKFMIGALMLVLLAMPFALSMMRYQPMDLEDISVGPIKTFGLSANPVVDAGGVVTNVDDTDNLYCGGYRDYIMTVNISDADSANDIANVTIIFKGTTELASFQWVNTTPTVWAELTGTDYIRLTSGVNTTHANDFDVTITFKLEWAFPDTDDIDIVTQVWGMQGAGDEVNDTADVNYDFDSDLTLASDVFFTNAEVQQYKPIPLNTLTYSYEDSLGAKYPLAAETDFYVSRAERPGYPAAYYEAASYVDGTGVATWNSMESTGGTHTDTFTLYAVNQAGGSSDTSLMGSTHTDTINVVEASPGAQVPRDVTGPEDEMFAMVQAGALLVAVVVLGGGAWYYSKSKSAPRKRTTRKRKPASKRKPRRKR